MRTLGKLILFLLVCIFSNACIKKPLEGTFLFNSDEKNATPIILAQGPTGLDNYYEIGAALNIEWVDSDIDDNAEISIFLTEHNTGTCDGGQLISSSLLEDDLVDSYSLNTGGLEDGIYYICLKITDNINPPQYSFTDRVVFFPNGVCTWLGDEDNDWDNANNWLGCPGGGAPLATDSILVLKNSPNSPQINLTKIVTSAAPGRGGGKVIVSPGTALRFSSATNTIGSDLKVEGTPGCSTCIVDNSTDTSFYIYNGATFELGTNIEFVGRFSRYIFVGSSSAVGHFKTFTNGAIEADWPVIDGSSNARIYVEGIDSSNKSSVEIDGLYIEDVTWCCSSAGRVSFEQNYEIKQLDNITFKGSQGHYLEQSVVFNNCPSASFTDTTWDGLKFLHGRESDDSIDASNCSGIAPGLITISERGPNNGSFLEDDPNNIFNWSEASTTSFNCEFTAAIDNDFHNSGNWNNCNDRTGVPDAHDSFYIPTGLTAETSTPTILRGIGPGSGGGTLKIGTDAEMILTDTTNGHFRSDIIVEGITDTCTSCSLWIGGGMRVYSNLTLGNGISLRLPDTIHYVGNSTTYGGLISTNSSGNRATVSKYGENLHFIRGIVIEGPAGTPSVVNLNGIIFNDFDSPGTNFGLRFQGYFNVVRLDDVSINQFGPVNGNTIQFSDCTNGSISDTSWTNLVLNTTYNTGVGYNVNLSGANCNLLGPINVTGSGTGYSSTNENDPGGILNWL